MQFYERNNIRISIRIHKTNGERYASLTTDTITFGMYLYIYEVCGFFYTPRIFYETMVNFLSLFFMATVLRY